MGVCHRYLYLQKWGYVITIYSNKNWGMSSLFIVTARTLGVIKFEPGGYVIAISSNSYGTWKCDKYVFYHVAITRQSRDQ